MQSFALLLHCSPEPFLGLFLVGIVTAALASQKAGMAVLIAFFAAGALLLAQVRSPS
jgi:MFS transporter, UMF1 family